MKPSRVLPKSFHCSAFKSSVRKRRNPLSPLPAQNQLVKSAQHRKPITNAMSIKPMYSAPLQLSPSSSLSKVSSNAALISEKSKTTSSNPSDTSERNCTSVSTAAKYRNLSHKQSQNHKTYYTNDSDEAERLISKLNGSVLGFDMEWKVSYTKHVRKTALVQVCNRDTIILMHICHMERIPNSLKSLLADKSITKCGVNILGDARKLFNDYGVTVNGMLDLGPFAKSTNTFESLKRTRLSLQTLSEAVLGYTLDKGWVRTSDWESLPLSSSQFDYAATDAYACYLLWETIETIRQQLPIEPPRPQLIHYDAQLSTSPKARTDRVSVTASVTKQSSNTYANVTISTTSSVTEARKVTSTSTTVLKSGSAARKSAKASPIPSLKKKQELASLNAPRSDLKGKSALQPESVQQEQIISELCADADLWINDLDNDFSSLSPSDGISESDNRKIQSSADATCTSTPRKIKSAKISSPTVANGSPNKSKTNFQTRKKFTVTKCHLVAHDIWHNKEKSIDETCVLYAYERAIDSSGKGKGGNQNNPEGNYKDQVKIEEVQPMKKRTMVWYILHAAASGLPYNKSRLLEAVNGFEDLYLEKYHDAGLFEEGELLNKRDGKSSR